MVAKIGVDLAENEKRNPEKFGEVGDEPGASPPLEVVNVSQASKKWGMNPENRKCDAPGSWSPLPFEIHLIL